MFRVLQRVVASSKCRRMAFSPASSCTMKREINFKLLGRANAVPFQCESLRTKRSVPSSHGKSSVSSLEIYVMCNIRVSDEGRGATRSAVAPQFVFTYYFSHSALVLTQYVLHSLFTCNSFGTVFCVTRARIDETQSRDRIRAFRCLGIVLRAGVLVMCRIKKLELRKSHLSHLISSCRA